MTQSYNTFLSRWGLQGLTFIYLLWELMTSVSTCRRQRDCELRSSLQHSFNDTSQVSPMAEWDQSGHLLTILPDPKWKRNLADTVLFCIHSQDLPWGVYLCIRNRSSCQNLAFKGEQDLRGSSSKSTEIVRLACVFLKMNMDLYIEGWNRTSSFGKHAGKQHTTLLKEIQRKLH